MTAGEKSDRIAKLTRELGRLREELDRLGGAEPGGGREASVIEERLARLREKAEGFASLREQYARTADILREKLDCPSVSRATAGRIRELLECVGDKIEALDVEAAPLREEEERLEARLAELTGEADELMLAGLMGLPGLEDVDFLGERELA